MRWNQNAIAILMVLFAEAVMSSSALARDISPGETRLADDRLTPICNYLASDPNLVDLETLEFREAQQRLDNAETRLAMARERLVKEQEILDRIRPVVEQGAVAELQLNRQEQQVFSVQNEVLALESKISSLRSQLRRSTATLEKISTLREETGWCQE